MKAIRFIPTGVHAYFDYIGGIVLLVAPFIFGFSSNGGATRFMIIAGGLELMTALSTAWEPGDAYAPASRRDPSGMPQAR